METSQEPTVEQVQEPTMEPCYEQLFQNEKKIRETLDKDIQEKNKEIEKLKKIVGSKEREIAEAKKQILSYKNSETAKNGYKEEELVCIDLTNETIKNKFSPMLGDEYDECSRISGNHKCDIQSNNNKVTGQVKKYKEGQFQQLDRHWVDGLLNYIPELNEASQILKDLCELPVLSNGTHVDKTIPVKKIGISNYSQENIDNFTMLLNKNKRQILNYAFMGTNSEIQPEYLFGVEYVDNTRTKIIILKIKEIIDYFETLDFKISNKETVIKLGDDSILSLQRKGGDSGKKSSNQLQIKIIVSKIIHKVDHLHHTL